MLVIRRIEVTYRLKIDDEHRDSAERVLEFHADYCPVAKTLSGCVEIEIRLEMV